MKKIALFVEGQTEQLFVKKLIEEVVGTKGLVIESFKFIGGHTDARKLITIQTKPTDLHTDYYFVIYDSGSDSKVKDDIVENLQSLQREQFSLVLGIRDVYPQKLAPLRKYLNYGIVSTIPAHIVLAVNETEGWFIADENHYSKIYPKLTLQYVNQIAGIDVSKDSTEVLPHPAETLKQIYRGHLKYDKSRHKTQRIVQNFDYANLYIEVRKRNNSFNELLTYLDEVMII